MDWYPWGEEALEKARREDKPILLSIGYSACHWCHVMERESFENEAIAEVMNSHFVNVKVDREERPDLDTLYMNYVQMTTGSGGWPMTVFLTPDEIPFFGGTYFPPDDRFGRPGFGRLCLALAEAYREKREEIEARGPEILQRLAAMNTLPAGAATGDRRQSRPGLRPVGPPFRPDPWRIQRRPQVSGIHEPDLSASPLFPHRPLAKGANSWR